MKFTLLLLVYTALLIVFGYTLGQATAIYQIKVEHEHIQN